MSLKARAEIDNGAILISEQDDAYCGLCKYFHLAVTISSEMEIWLRCPECGSKSQVQEPI